MHVEDCVDCGAGIIRCGDQPFLIHDRRGGRGWWREDSKGYTTDINEAGRYSGEEIGEIAKRCARGDITVEICPHWVDRDKCDCFKPFIMPTVVEK